MQEGSYILYEISNVHVMMRALRRPPPSAVPDVDQPYQKEICRIQNHPNAFNSQFLLLNPNLCTFKGLST